MSIVTKKGDGGYTSLLYGERVSKTNPRVCAVGAVDALNVELGAIKTLLPNSCITRAFLEDIQRQLVGLMGELTVLPHQYERYLKSNFNKLKEEDLAVLDEKTSEIEARFPSFEGWATPGVNALEIAFERARVTARAAERAIILIHTQEYTVRGLILQYVNRLSDFLWLMARQTANQLS